MKIKEQFSRYAKSYEKYSIVQQLGVKQLLNSMPKDLGLVVELGCGSGRVYKELKKEKFNFSRFFGVDFSKKMLSLHPQDKNTTLIEGDFNSKELFKSLPKCDSLISASALQWSKDLDFVFKNCANFSKNGYFFIFTSNTFKTIHKIVDVKSPIYTKEQVVNSFLKHYKKLKIEPLEFKIEFNSTWDMLKYIKNSGVSGGGFNLGVSDIRKILREYPYNYLEFETVILIGKSYENR